MRSGKKSKAELLAAICLLCFSAIYTLSSLRLKIGRISNPGPGLMPLLLGFALAVCALVYLMQQIRKRPSRSEAASMEFSEGWRDHLTPLSIVAAVAVYPFLLPWLNFLLATSLVVCGILLVLRFKTPLMSLLVGVVMTALCYILFARVLGVVLPAGPLEDFLLKRF